MPVHHSCLGLIHRCEQLELIRRFENPTDRRSVCVELTPKGRELLERLTIQHQAELKRLGLSHRNFLEKALASFDMKHESGSIDK
jgi:DNA-binding MarR family transcriptional regulator